MPQSYPTRMPGNIWTDIGQAAGQLNQGLTEYSKQSNLLQDMVEKRRQAKMEALFRQEEEFRRQAKEEREEKDRESSRKAMGEFKSFAMGTPAEAPQRYLSPGMGPNGEAMSEGRPAMRPARQDLQDRALQLGVYGDPGVKAYMDDTQGAPPAFDPQKMQQFQSDFLPRIQPHLQKVKKDPTLVSEIAYMGASQGLAGFEPFEKFMDNLKGARPESSMTMDRFNAAREDAQFGQEKTIREKWQAETKDFRDVRDAYGRIKTSANKPSAAGDLSLIFNYMKMLDPGSTVREGEFATAAASGSLGDRFVAAGKKLVTGERLDPSQRADFLSRAESLYAQQEAQAKKASDEARKLAQMYKLNPDRVIMDQGQPTPSAPAMPQEGATKVNSSGRKVIFKGGAWRAAQ